MLIIAIIGIIIWALWETYITSPAYIYRKYPEQVIKNKLQDEEFNKINADYCKRRAELGYPVPDDYEIYHNCKK